MSFLGLAVGAAGGLVLGFATVKNDAIQRWAAVDKPGDGHYDPTLTARNDACNQWMDATCIGIRSVGRGCPGPDLQGKSDTEYANAHNADCKYVFDTENSADVRLMAYIGALGLVGAGVGYLVTKK